MVSLRWAWAPEPASWLEGAPFLKIPRLGRRQGVEPVYPWDRFPAHPKAAMMIIKGMTTIYARAANGYIYVGSSAESVAKDNLLKPDDLFGAKETSALVLRL